MKFEKLKNRYKVCTAVSALIAAVLVVFVGCDRGRSYDESEISSAAAELIESSYEINEIFFGRGLPTVSTEGQNGSEAADGKTSDGEAYGSTARYAEVSEESPYHTEDEIRTAALLVYTPSYCEALFETAFSGGSGSGDSGSVLYARYVDYNGILTARILDEDEILPINRTYDTGSITVVSQKNGSAKIKVPSFKDGVPSDDITLSVVLTDDGWRLDTPTY